MSQQEPLTAKVALTQHRAETLRQPIQLQLVFDQALLQTVAKASVTLAMQNDATAWLSLYLGDSPVFLDSDRPWVARRDGHDLVVSAVWMHVESDRLYFEIWESNSSDQLNATMAFAEHPALHLAVEQHRRWAEDSLVRDLQELYAVRSRDPDAMRDMVRSRRRTEPWLEKMAMHLAAETPGRALDGSDVQRTLRRTLALAPAPERDAGQNDLARSNPAGER